MSLGVKEWGNGEAKEVQKASQSGSRNHKAILASKADSKEDHMGLLYGNCRTYN
jgi:hypothetical protein